MVHVPPLESQATKKARVITTTKSRSTANTKQTKTMLKLITTTVAATIAIIIASQANTFIANPDVYGKSPGQLRQEETSRSLEASVKAMDAGWDERRKMCALPREQQQYPYMCD